MGGGHGPITYQGHAVPQEGWEGGTLSPLPSWVPSDLAGNDERDHKKQLEHQAGSSIMNPEQENLLEDFEEFELDLEVEEILKKVKADCVLDQGVTQFAEQLEERDRRKRAAQEEREAQVEELWSPGHYPQLTCDWFVEGLDYCCSYWRYQFKRPLTPPPAPPPSPEPCRTAKKRPRKN